MTSLSGTPPLRQVLPPGATRPPAASSHSVDATIIRPSALESSMKTAAGERRFRTRWSRTPARGRHVFSKPTRNWPVSVSCPSVVPRRRTSVGTSGFRRSVVHRSTTRIPL